MTKPVMPGPEGWGQPALPGSAGRRRAAPATRWLIGCPPSGVRPLSLIRPPAWPFVRAQRPAAA